MAPRKNISSLHFVAGTFFVPYVLYKYNTKIVVHSSISNYLTIQNILGGILMEKLVVKELYQNQ